MQWRMASARLAGWVTGGIAHVQEAGGCSAAADGDAELVGAERQAQAQRDRHPRPRILPARSVRNSVGASLALHSSDLQIIMCHRGPCTFRLAARVLSCSHEEHAGAQSLMCVCKRGAPGLRRREQVVGAQLQHAHKAQRAPQA